MRRLDKPFEDPIVVTLAPAVGTAAVPASSAAPQRETPANCTELLALEPRIAGARPASDWVPLRQRLADCQALRWLKRAVVPSRSALLSGEGGEGGEGGMGGLERTALWPGTLWPAISPDELDAASARPERTLREASWRAQAVGGSWRDVRTLLMTRAQPGRLSLLRGVP